MKYLSPSLARLTILLIIAAAGCGKKQPDVQPPPKIFSPPSSFPRIDGAEALALVKAQTAFGPRVPNSAAHDACLSFYKSEFEKCGAKVSLQSFSLTGYDGQPLRLTNVIAAFAPEKKQRVLLCAHWDSRPRADQEKDPALQSKPILGANDGASGCAVLIALARRFASQPPPVGVDIVLFDGEDYGKESDHMNYCLGAKYFATTLASDYHAMFGILLDLVGDGGARFYKEGHSLRFAPDVVDLVWSAAASLKKTKFIADQCNEILDDHYSLNTIAGIKTIDIIDAELIGYSGPDPRRKYWHTLADTDDIISAQTLADVGDVVSYVVYGLIARL